jgi:glutamate decarboxylase
VPAYTFPPNREDLSVLRVVCRNGFSSDLADLFVEDLTRLLPELHRQPHPWTKDKTAATGFHH